MGTGRKKFINDIKRLGVILLFLVLTLWQFSSLELFFKQTINNFNTELIIKNMALFATANIVLVCIVSQNEAGIFNIIYFDNVHRDSKLLCHII